MTPADIQNKTFEKRMSGYRTDEVDAYLAEVAAYVQKVLDDKEEMEKKMLVLAEKVEEYREDEDSLRAALIGAQKLGDNVVREAKKKAEIVLAEASMKAEEMIADAKGSIDREAISLSRMQGQVAEFKARILDMYKRHIEVINTIPDEVALTGDVRLLFGNANANAAAGDQSVERAARIKEDAIDNFVLKYEDDDLQPDDSADSKSKTSHKRNDYGNLRFGEEYNLTRKE